MIYHRGNDNVQTSTTKSPLFVLYVLPFEHLMTRESLVSFSFVTIAKATVKQLRTTATLCQSLRQNFTHEISDTYVPSTTSNWKKTRRRACLWNCTNSHCNFEDAREKRTNERKSPNHGVGCARINGTKEAPRGARGQSRNANQTQLKCDVSVPATAPPPSPPYPH